MPETINQSEAINEATGPEGETPLALEIENDKELENITGSMSRIQDAIDHDNPVKMEAVLDLQEALENLTIDIGGDKVPIKELGDDWNIKNIIKILSGNFEAMFNLTRLPESVARILGKLDQALTLNELASLSPEAARALVGDNKHPLWLRGLTSISTETAEILSEYKGYLILDGLTELSGELAKALVGQQESISLNALVSLPDNAAEELANFPGDLRFDKLRSLSDGAAKALSGHQGKLTFEDLNEISEVGAKSLARHKDFWGVGERIWNKIKKYQ